jgi:hypothetical protein
MTMDDPLVPEPDRVTMVTRDEPPTPGATILATRDRVVICEWADLNCAEPATGEETASGPASAVKITDGGSGLRFNFPGVGPFRAISWDEWFDHFNRYDLTFVFDNPEMRRPPSARYRLVPTKDLARSALQAD